MRNQIHLVTIAAILTTVSAMATTTVDEPFSYSAGTSLAGGGTGFAAAWGSVAATGPGSATAGASSLAAGALATSGGSAVLTAAKDGTNDGLVSITRDLAAPLVSNPDGAVTVQPYYLSFVADIDDALWNVSYPSQRQWGTSLLLTLKDSNGHSMSLGKAGGSLTWGLSTQGFSTGFAGATYTDQPALIVMKFTPGSWDVTDLSLWVNPTDLGGAEPAASGTGSTNIGYTFSQIELSASISGWLPSSGPSFSHQIDEIHIGSSWADVTPVPEPSALAAFGVAAGMCFRRRRPA